MNMSRIGGIGELEFRSVASGTVAWGRADGVLRRLFDFPSALLPAVRLRLWHAGWETAECLDTAAAVIVRLTHPRVTTERVCVAGLDRVTFAPGTLTVCRVAPWRRAPDARRCMAETHPDARVFSAGELRHAFHAAMLGDAVCVLEDAAEPLAPVAADRGMFDAIAPRRMAIRLSRGICVQCRPAGSGCAACDRTGFSDPVLTVFA